jgi:tripartite-type tricarboxylate transporter receptor subunit TctC
MMEKKRISMTFLCWTFVLVALGVGTGICHAADYPTRPITLVVPYSPGGGSDLASKIMADKVSEFLGQPVVSDYKPGAAGALGAAFVAKAKPDGYTLLVGSQSPLIVSPLTKEGLGYTFDDLIPVCGYSKISVMINAKPDGPWKTLKEFIADAQRNPGKYRYSTYGALSMAHFVMELLSKEAGLKLTHIPYDGSPKANAALLGGHVDIACTTGTGGLYEAKSLNILAIADKERLSGMPEVPTLTELGYPSIQLDAQYAFCVPKGTPKEVIDKLYDAHKKAFQKYGKELAEGFLKVEQYSSFLSPEETLKKYQREMGIYQAIAKDLGVLAKP